MPAPFGWNPNVTPGTAADPDQHARFSAIEDGIRLLLLRQQEASVVIPDTSLVDASAGGATGGGGGGGGGSDVEPGTVDGQLLRWNDADGVWEPALYSFLSEDGELLLEPGSDVTAFTIQMVNGQTRPPFLITDENGVVLFSFGDDGTLTVRPHDTGSPALTGVGYGSSASLTGYAERGGGTRGTRGSPAALQSGDYEHEWTASAQYDTTDGHRRTNVVIRARAAENQDATHAGGELDVYTTPNGSTTLALALTIRNSGNLLAAQKVLATGGLGAGNFQAASALGALSGVLEVFDTSGVSLGYVPVYASFTP